MDKEDIKLQLLDGTVDGGPIVPPTPTAVEIPSGSAGGKAPSVKPSKKIKAKKYITC